MRSGARWTGRIAPGSTLPLLVVLAAFLAPQAAVAQAVSSETQAVPTFYRDVLPIVQQNCQVCHQKEARSAGGMLAPMALETYEEVRPWSRMIARVVAEGRMPPWGADPQHRGTFIGERYLHESEKATLIAWADEGAPAGDPAEAPAALVQPTRTGDWWLGEPDLVVGFAAPVEVGDDVDDWQPTIPFVVPQEQHTEPRWIRSSELKPGGPYVHHIVSSHLGVGTPGRGSFEYPKGYGILLPTNPVITLNMHYYKDPGPGTGFSDETKGAFKFYEPGEVIDYIVETDLNPQREFLIPAGDPNYVITKARPFAEDSYLLSMGPHMHYRGKSVKMELEYPDGNREVLLWVPRYDFRWQFLYQYQEPKFIPAGSVLHTTWTFDNSTNNPDNPDPGIDVRYGLETYWEMANARIYYASARKRGIVVGEPIPEDVLEKSRRDEERRRQQLERAEGVE